MDLSWLSTVDGQRALYAVGFIAVVLVIRRLLVRPKASPHLVERQCACGWRGRVSRYKPVCPRCGSYLAG